MRPRRAGAPAPARASVWARGRALCRGDEGSTLLLTIFYGFLCLLVILVVVAAGSLYLERKRLFALADGAALAGAEAFDLDAVTVTAGPSRAVLRPALRSSDVQAAARTYLADAPRGGIEGLTVVRAVSADGQSATVTLRAWWRPPVLTVLLPAGTPLEVTAVARAVFR